MTPDKKTTKKKAHIKHSETYYEWKFIPDKKELCKAIMKSEVCIIKRTLYEDGIEQMDIRMKM